MGAAKAGVTCVVFSEKDDSDAFHMALKDSGARGLLVSPSTAVNEDGATRQSFL